MLVQQAVFTSVRSGRNEGYQLAACSPGVSPVEARELSQWGPSHDSLYGQLPIAESVNCHRLQSGNFCVGQTVLAGCEYSGRGGERVYTQMFLIPPDLMQRFANSPFPIIDALAGSGRLSVWEDAAPQLAAIPLIGRASPANAANLEYVAGKIGPQRLATLVGAALKIPTLGVCSPLPGRRLFAALLDLLPLPYRCEFSLTTGLRVSASRPYRLSILPDDREEQRRAVRQLHLTVLDLLADAPAKYAPHAGWPLLVHQLLRNQQFSALASIAQYTAQTAERDADLLAEQVRENLEKDADQGTILTSLPA